MTATATNDQAGQITSTLDALDIAWERCTGQIPFDRLVDPEGGNIRSLDTEKVDEYATALQRGDQFPPLLCERTTDNRLAVIGGRHRWLAAERTGLGQWPHGAIITATLDDTQRLLVGAADNAKHGLSMSKDDRKAISLRLRAAGIDTVRRVVATGLSRQVVEIADGAEDAIHRADTLGLPQIAGLIESVRWRLGTIEDDDVFEDAVIACCEHRPDAQQAFALVSEARAAATPAEARQAIATAIASWSISNAAGKRQRGKRATSHQRISDATAMLAPIDPDHIQLAELDRRTRRLFYDQVLHAQQVIDAALAELSA